MNQAIAELLNKEVGRVRLSKPIEQTDRGFECAAWWETVRSATGVFPVYLRQDYYDKKRIFFAAEIPSIIVEDCFVSLFCGNVIGKYDTKQNAGNRARRNVCVVREFDVGILNTCNSDDDEKGVKMAIRPRHWSAFVEYCHLQVRRAHEDLIQYWWPKYQASGATADIGMVGYMGELMRGYAKKADEIALRIKWREEQESRGYSQYSPDYYIKNNPFMA